MLPGRCSPESCELVGASGVQDLQHRVLILRSAVSADIVGSEMQFQPYINTYMFAIRILNGGIITLYPYILYKLCCKTALPHSTGT
jgi:hypothetical protein